MPEDLLSVEITDQAETPYTSLGPEDRRRVDAWLEHLRNWRNDDFIRSKSRRVQIDERDVYVLQTGSDFVIAFAIVSDKIKVLSIFREAALRPFEAMTEQSVP